MRIDRRKLQVLLAQRDERQYVVASKALISPPTLSAMLAHPTISAPPLSRFRQSVMENG